MSTFDTVLAFWLVLSAPISFMAGMFVAAQNDEEWITNKGVCPVPPNVKVDLLLSGGIFVRSVIAGDWVWYRDPSLLSEGMTIHFWRAAS